MSTPAEPTHYAVEYIPRGWMDRDTLTRRWTRWSDGSTAHEDTVSTHHTLPSGFVMFGSMYVNIGATLMPHDGLVWHELKKEET